MAQIRVRTGIDDCSRAPTVALDPRQDAVDHSRVHRVAEQREIGQRARAFFHHHLLRVEHHPIAGDRRVGEHLLQLAHAVHQVIQAGKDVFIGHETLDKPHGQADGGIAPAHETGHVPLKTLRHGQQTDGFARGRGVHNHPLEIALLCLLVDVEQADHLYK